jgi:hypothetical protein
MLSEVHDWSLHTSIQPKQRYKWRVSRLSFLPPPSFLSCFSLLPSRLPPSSDPRECYLLFSFCRWGFHERALPCGYLGRIALTNRLVVPPSGLAFDESQDEHKASSKLSNSSTRSTQLLADFCCFVHLLGSYQNKRQSSGGFYIGVGWTALPIFGGKTRTDPVGLKPSFDTSNGPLSW